MCDAEAQLVHGDRGGVLREHVGFRKVSFSASFIRVMRLSIDVSDPG